MVDMQSDTIDATHSPAQAEGKKTEPHPGIPPDASINHQDAIQYWESASADADSMLGGISSISRFSHVSKIDLQGSRSFLAKLGIGTKNGRRPVVNILEGGAGYAFFRVDTRL
jgi:protein N-terminal methyltransferase